MYPSARTALICFAVNELAYIAEVIAGHTRTGVEEGSDLRSESLRSASEGGRAWRAALTARLSENPAAIFASMSAEHGTTTTRSAHLLNSVCRMGSPGLFHPSHSSASVHRRTPHSGPLPSSTRFHARRTASSSAFWS